MNRLWAVLAAFTGPGVAQALVGRRIVAVVFVTAFAVACVSIGFSIYGLVLALGVHVLSMLDTIIYVARHEVRSFERTLEAGIFWVTLVLVAGGVRGFVAESAKFPTSSMVPALAVNDHVFISKRAGWSRGDIVMFDHPCMPAAYVKRVIALGGDSVEIRCGSLYVNDMRVPHESLGESTYKDLEEGRWFTRTATRYRETLGGRTYEIFDKPEPQGDFPRGRGPSCDRGGASFDEGKPGGEDVDPCKPHHAFVVPPGHAFMLGDNRGNSNDSRHWGTVSVANIRGRVMGIWLPLDRFGPVH